MDWFILMVIEKADRRWLADQIVPPLTGASLFPIEANDGEVSPKPEGSPAASSGEPEH